MKVGGGVKRLPESHFRTSYTGLFRRVSSNYDSHFYEGRNAKFHSVDVTVWVFVDFKRTGKSE